MTKLLNKLLNIIRKPYRKYRKLVMVCHNCKERFDPLELEPVKYDDKLVKMCSNCVVELENKYDIN